MPPRKKKVVKVDKGATPEELQNLAEIEEEVKSRAEDIVEEKYQFCEGLKIEQQMLKMKLPKMVRDLPLSQFCREIGEGVEGLLIEDMIKKWQAKQQETAARPPRGAAGGEGMEGQEPATARKGRPAGLPPRSFAMTDAQVPGTAAGRPRRGAAAGPGRAAAPSGFLAMTPAVGLKARGVAATPAVLGTVPRAAKAGESVFSVNVHVSENGSPLLVEDPSGAGPAAPTPMVGFPKQTPMPGGHGVAAPLPPGTVMFAAKGPRGGAKGVRRRPRGHQDPIIVVLKDGSQIPVDPEGLCLENVPVQKRDEVLKEYNALIYQALASQIVE